MANAADNQLSASLEDYLEAILRIVQDKSAVRAKDIGERLKVSRSSVTGALRALADRELVNYTPYGVITLTDKGQAIAEDVAWRHRALRDFFVNVLSVDRADADVAACRIEHVIPEAVLKRLVDFAEFAERQPHGEPGPPDGRCRADDVSAARDRGVEENDGGKTKKDTRASMR